MREMALFAVIRLALWLGIWWLLTQIQVGVMLAGVLAAVIAMLLSILFLDRLRSKVALRWKAADDRRRVRRGEKHDEDAEAEDAYLDAHTDDDSFDGGSSATGVQGAAAEDWTRAVDGGAEAADESTAGERAADAGTADEAADEGPEPTASRG
ncbi:DUF4229 domain-containing protein [Brachybacterium alimentarium]|uniref:DUF4229 domain-containing protein n=1 Tax=Brachybacterium alimentarium TaxID=47845 RepID=UPI000DF35449|nr:DUF4229 domain-containing protein [Brachybacterium alimentarium]RCS94069.1 DUF4229 domain-containing protein [Brachybacterium alimentarium]